MSEREAQAGEPGLEAVVGVASDPRTEGGRLAELARHLRVEVRAAVAANPNTPADALRGLIGVVGGERVVDNPALGLLLMVDPMFVRRLSLEHRRWLARQRMPRPLCEAMLAEGPMVREVLARHQALDDELARRLLESFAGGDSTPGGRLLLEALADALAANPTAPAWATLEAARAVGLRRMPSGVEVERVLEAMASSADPLVRAMAGGDPRAPEGLLERLAADDSSLVRRAVAASALATEAMLEALVSDGSAQVRQAVGRNPRAPRWMLRKLARDPSEYVNDRARQRLKRTGAGW